jgi:hypothetical protein
MAFNDGSFFVKRFLYVFPSLQLAGLTLVLTVTDVYLLL